jgi:hypothetical protein
VRNLIDHQVLALCKRQAIELFKAGARKGAYSSIRRWRPMATIDLAHAA